MKGPQFSAETNKQLSEANMKLTMQLASKDTVIDEKTAEIESLNNHSKQLVTQIAETKSSSADRAAALEKEIQQLKSELEESRASKVRELESQRVYLQKEIDQASKVAEERESRVSVCYFLLFLLHLFFYGIEMENIFLSFHFINYFLAIKWTTC